MNVWIIHGDSDDYYGVAGIYGVAWTRELAVSAAEAYVHSQTGVTFGLPVTRIEWRGNRLHVFRSSNGNVEVEITEHVIEGFEVPLKPLI